MLQQSNKVSLIPVSVEQLIYLFDHQVLPLANSADNPLETPLSHLKGRTILTNGCG
jgi:hypothetical protein